MISQPGNVALVVVHELDDHVRDCGTGGPGTGTTGLAALQVGRQFLGVDRAAVSMATDPLSRDL
jgi:hypothetical protein